VSESKSESIELRVLVLAPTTRDAAVTCSVFATAGLPCDCCSDLAELCEQLKEGAGAILVPEEAIVADKHDCLADWLRNQPPWSDLPVLVLARTGADSAAVAQAMDLLGNVTVLERPTRVAALVSAVRAALRARHRQYQNRDYLADLERSDRELREFFDNASVGLHWVGPDGIILRVNQTELNMLGYRRDEYVGHHIAEFHADKAALDDILQRLAAGETLYDYVARLRCKDGSIRDVLIDSSVHWEGNRFVHTRCFTRDITDRKRAEEALKEADRRKDEFLAILAHELRNPLAPIRNSLYILRLSGSNNPVAERVNEMMERQVNHMVRLVDDLMEVSRITRGRIELRKEPVELETVLRDAMETSRPLIEAAHHQLIFTMPRESFVLQGDPVRLGQVFANLLNNAAKYTEDGGQIRLSVRREDDCVLVSVQDTGSGISTEMLPRIFELFTQVERSAARSQGGLGIGLTLVKTLVEMHGGTVHARSAGRGKGSEFVVSLPLGVKSVLAERKEDKGSAPVRHRVLVVDDNCDAAESLAMLLQMLGAEVRVVFSGSDALETLRTYNADVVLLDIGMPIMDGYEVARRIRERSELTGITLIALTGWGQDEDRRRSQSAGFDYHLIKPADPKKLETLLTSLDRGSDTSMSA
jgi:PAS domain S-box-containing protein